MKKKRNKQNKDSFHVSYSFFDRLLHNLVLSNKKIILLLFQLEKLIQKRTFDSGEHIFICGMPRSGSTSLLNLIYDSKKYASITYKDMPFIFAPNIWSWLQLRKDNRKILRAHNDKILVSQSSPEAFEEAFWVNFSSKDYKSFINLYLRLNCKNKYLSKSNQNIKRINKIIFIYPKSKIIIPFRSPLFQAQSIYNQHIRMCELNNVDPFVGQYMSLIGHDEFGPNFKKIKLKKYDDILDPNYWLELWIFIYKILYKNYKSTNNVKFLCYEKFGENSLYRDELFKFINNRLNPKSKSFAFKNMNTNKKVFKDYDPQLIKESNNLYDTLVNLK